MENKIIISSQNENSHCEKIVKQSMYNDKITSYKKPAMTLAEILIVVVIIAIVACVLMAMPRKNVSVTDKAKYYIAYSTLERLLSEQMADSGKIALSIQDENDKCSSIEEDQEGYETCLELKSKFNIDKTFDQMVEKWLNVADTVDTSNHKARLTNGMELDWSGKGSDNKDGPDGNKITTAKTVCIDIDGPDEGRSLQGKDKHCFLLYRLKNSDNTYGEVKIKPIDTTKSATYNIGDNVVPTSNDTWLTFKVFTVDDNGKMEIRLLDKDYKKSYDCYENIDGNSCGDACEDGKCFIEPIRPLN